MNTRSIFWLFTLALALILQVRHSSLLHDGHYLAFAFAILVTSFLLPGVVVPVALGAFRIDPNDVHHHIAVSAMWIVAAMFWWYIGDRGRRVAGVFDAFEKSERRSGHISRAFAKLRDMYDRRRFGREKTGGWA